jgi:hypothetical protein
VPFSYFILIVFQGFLVSLHLTLIGTRRSVFLSNIPVLIRRNAGGGSCYIVFSMCSGLPQASSPSFRKSIVIRGLKVDVYIYKLTTCGRDVITIRIWSKPPSLELVALRATVRNEEILY